jgi:hypothetical protein
MKWGKRKVVKLIYKMDLLELRLEMILFTSIA